MPFIFFPSGFDIGQRAVLRQVVLSTAEFAVAEPARSVGVGAEILPSAFCSDTQNPKKICFGVDDF